MLGGPAMGRSLGVPCMLHDCQHRPGMLGIPRNLAIRGASGLAPAAMAE
jgi:hypothetical protein